MHASCWTRAGKWEEEFSWWTSVHIVIHWEACCPPPTSSFGHSLSCFCFSFPFKGPFPVYLHPALARFSLGTPQVILSQTGKVCYASLDPMVLFFLTLSCVRVILRPFCYSEVWDSLRLFKALSAWTHHIVLAIWSIWIPRSVFGKQGTGSLYLGDSIFCLFFLLAWSSILSYQLAFSV